MDVLKEIELQINSIKKFDSSNYLDSIFTHIDRAELYYKQGKSDSNFFNDVIYRGNQAYEGALKESYKVLADKTEEEVFKQTPNEIEKFFETNNIFRERVLQLFKNYRQEWRNKSTHDFKLFFDESEAFIALTSVSSFVHLLLKQIQEKIAYQTQQKKLTEQKENAEKINDIVISNSVSPIDKLVNIIVEFSRQNSEQIYNNKQEISEGEIMGLFHAYIESVSNLVNTQREPQFNIGGRHIRPDFLIEIDNEPLILEFKRMKATGSIINNSINQVLLYMQATNSKRGMIYYANFNEPNPEPKIKKNVSILNDKTYHITIITT
ncbi:MAG: GxxExxY protein [Bacteroidetes bacterium]|nr:GxxExxY protein [Bacteroidota bacterium]MBU2268184.1 GxxExxY protein [Bacteroidota bacterium]MBU2374565.1 GxxExxY protein [Bacteroidota bacterium]